MSRVSTRLLSSNVALGESATVVLPELSPVEALTPRRIRTVTGVAVGIGVAGDLLVAETFSGLGLTTYLILCAAAFALLSRAESPATASSVSRRIALGVAVGFASLLMLRDSETMQFFNCVAVFVALALAASMVEGSPLNIFALRVRDVVLAAVVFVRDAASGSLRFLLTDAPRFFAFGETARDAHMTSAIARAVVIGTALTATFGALLAAGDPVFGHAMGWFVRWNIPRVAEHAFRIGVFAWPALGLLWLAQRRLAEQRLQQHSSALNSEADAAPHTAVGTLFAQAHAIKFVGAPALNRLDALIALGSMNAVFAVFVLFQLRTLFGGQAYVLSTTGLTLAEYARDGFFTLTFTAGLVVGTLLALDAALKQDGLAKWHVARRLSLSLLTLMDVVLVSAFTRMMLYVHTFGISVDRITALAVMTWVAVISVLFVSTVMRGRHSRFVPSALVAAAVVLLSLNLTNVDAIVAASGVARSTPAEMLNAQYFTRSLSGDAVPTLVRAIRSSALNTASLVGSVTLTQSDACRTSNLLLARWGRSSEHRATGWTYGSWRARRAVVANEAMLKAQCPVRPATTVTR